ncbi:MAG: alanine racemase [Oscillospiraceae bacterium]|nr:alanine racemase [Oscillospiraceae bacterium]
MTTYAVSREMLAGNIRQLKAQAGAVPIWAVVKGDGYGLGVLPLAEVLSEEGITHFCVTDVKEAEILRDNSFTEDKILMLRSVNDRGEINRLLDLKVILTVGSEETARLVDQIAAERADVAEVHLKIDTGMGRYGFLPEQIDRVIALYGEMKHLAISGIFTHFNCAFNNEKLTRQEFAAFMNVVEAIRAAGQETGVVHCCNSAAFLKYPEMHCNGVRLGSALLGRMPFRTKLHPVGCAVTQLDEVRTLPAGHTTGYSALWKAKKDTRIAIIPVGWYHGFRVSCQPELARNRDCLRAALSALKQLLRKKKATVMIAGKQCPVIGAVGMLHCAVDVSGVDCKCGDPATVQISPLHVKGMPVVFRA